MSEIGSNEIISTHIIECRGIGSATKEYTQKAVSRIPLYANGKKTWPTSDISRWDTRPRANVLAKPVQVLVSIFRNGAMRVCCPCYGEESYTGDNPTSPKVNRCLAQPGNFRYPHMHEDDGDYRIVFPFCHYYITQVVAGIIDHEKEKELNGEKAS